MLGKVLFGRQRLAFEVQEIDNRHAAVKRILKKEQELDEARFGRSEFDFGRKDGEKGLTLFDALKASQLAAKYSIQVKWQDIEKVEIQGDEVTLNLTKAPQCYVKPEGEMPIVNMDVSKDITGGARCIKFRSADASAENVRAVEKHTRFNFSKVRPMVAQHSPRMDALFRGQAPPQPVPTPARKRKNPDESGAGKKQRVDASKISEDISAPDGSWLKKAVDQFELKGIRNTFVSENQWKQYVEEREALEWNQDGAEEDEEEEEREEDEDFDGVVPARKIIPTIRASVEATLRSTTLKLDAAAFARGVFLLSHDMDSRAVESHSRIYAPNATGNFVDLFYQNHHRVRMSFTERYSHLHASRGGPGIQPVHPDMPNGKKKCDTIFNLDSRLQVSGVLFENLDISRIHVRCLWGRDCQSELKTLKNIKIYKNTKNMFCPEMLHLQPRITMSTAARTK